MFPNPAIITRNALAQATLSNPDNRGVDLNLAGIHRDMEAQAMNPSALRKAHDNAAFDDRAYLPLSQLTEYLVSADSLKRSGKATEHMAALEVLDRTVKSAYEKSPCFRRLFNFAWGERLNDKNARAAISVFDRGEQETSSVLALPNVLKRGPKPKYESAIGTSRLSDERAALNSVVKLLTQLPEQELGHPRGPIPEYVNIILKEMGIRDSAQTALATGQIKAKSIGQGPAAVALNQVMLRLGNSARPSSPGKVLKEKVRAHLNEVVAEHVSLMDERGVPRSPYLAQIERQERQAAQQFPDLLMRLFRRVDGEENPVKVLEKLSVENSQQRMFAYRIDKIRSPIQMVASRDGDCQSFCTLYKMLGEAAQIKDISQLNMEGPMHVQFSTPFLGAPSAQPRESFSMERHSILKLNDSQRSYYFDPVFGQQVDPNFYGQDPDRYFLKA